MDEDPAKSDEPARRATRAIVALAAVALCYLAALELIARTLFMTHSALERRIDSDWHAALRIGGAGADRRRDFVLVGNSLLQLGVDRESLRVLQENADIRVTMMPVENTWFLDWYFGAQRLLSEGSRPQFVVLTLSVPNLTSRRTDGAYFAWRLMRRQDILRVKQAADLDWTTTSTYLLASFSAWIGNGDGIRNWIRVRTLPGMTGLAAYFPERAQSSPPAAALEKIIAPRLAQFSAICAAHGCKAVLLIPPMVADPDQLLSAVARAASTAHMTFVLPMSPGELGPQFFSDGYHLNAAGAARFTPRLVEALREVR
jgi:hypothetical protein